MYSWRLNIEYGHGDETAAAVFGTMLIAAGVTPFVLRRRKASSGENSEWIDRCIKATGILVEDQKSLEKQLADLSRFSTLEAALNMKYRGEMDDLTQRLAALEDAR